MLSSIAVARPAGIRSANCAKRLAKCAAQKDNKLQHALVAGLIATTLVAAPANAGFFPPVTGLKDSVEEADANTKAFDAKVKKAVNIKADEDPIKAIEEVIEGVVAKK